MAGPATAAGSTWTSPATAAAHALPLVGSDVSDRDQTLRSSISTMMDQAWRQPGFCVPNRSVYPHQWLWDSCFHAVIWTALGSDRGVREVDNVLANIGADGFVPHMTYWTSPRLHARFWGRPLVSTITQPPMYGHAIAELVRAGHQVSTQTIDRARAGLIHLGRRRRTGAGLIPVFHPWETGCDDSARWDSCLPPGVVDRVAVWRDRKGRLVEALRRSPEGHAVDSEAFIVGSVGFNALVAWNADELLHVLPGDPELTALAFDVSRAVADRWRKDRWVDDGPPSGRIRTLDAMLALLVDPRDGGFDALIDPGAYGAPFGPRGVHRAEPTYEPDVYWRGPAWPQLSYLLLVAADRAGHDVTEILARLLVDGAGRSDLAEYWHPETGSGLGAKPQCWAGLALPALDRLSNH